MGKTLLVCPVVAVAMVALQLLAALDGTHCKAMPSQQNNGLYSSSRVAVAATLAEGLGQNIDNFCLMDTNDYLVMAIKWSLI